MFKNILLQLVLLLLEMEITHKINSRWRSYLHGIFRGPTACFFLVAIVFSDYTQVRFTASVSEMPPGSYLKVCPNTKLCRCSSMIPGRQSLPSCDSLSPIDTRIPVEEANSVFLPNDPTLFYTQPEPSHGSLTNLVSKHSKIQFLCFLLLLLCPPVLGLCLGFLWDWDLPISVSLSSALLLASILVTILTASLYITCTVRQSGYSSLEGYNYSVSVWLWLNSQLNITVRGQPVKYYCYGAVN